MIKTFVLGAEYDATESMDCMVQVGDTLTLNLVGKTLNNPIAYVKSNDISFELTVSDQHHFDIPASLIRAGTLDVVIVERVNGRVAARTWTLPPINLYENTYVYSGIDCIREVLNALPRIEQIEADIAEIKDDLFWLKEVNGDPLD